MMIEDTPSPVTGADLIGWGHRLGPAFPGRLARADAVRTGGFDLVRIRQIPPA